MTDILVLYYSLHGHTAKMARMIGRGVEEVAAASVRVRTVPPVRAGTEAAVQQVPDSGPPYVSRSDLESCDGLILGSPTRFGNMAAALKYFLDGTAAEWVSGTLAGKPAGLFTSTGSLHGGQESTLLSMALPLLHHGMLLVGLPFTEAGLSRTTAGGTPYGASHWSGSEGAREMDKIEAQLCRRLGSRVAQVANALRQSGQESS